MDGTGVAIAVMAVCGLILLVFGCILYATVYVAAKEASEYFRRKNDQYRQEWERQHG